MRADLIALTPEAVAALSNMGLVKRALRSIEEGQGPAISEAEDGTVTGRFTEAGRDIEARLIPGRSLKDCPCTCGATTVCRHRVGVALAYKSWAEAAVSAFVPWSPATFSDETLTALGRRVLDEARRMARGGVVIEVVRPTAADPQPMARLPSSAVRFLVPEDLSYARCDCVVTTGCAHVVLACWAFRAADAQDTAAQSLQVEVRAPGQVAEEVDLDVARALCHEVLTEGVIHTPEVIEQQFVAAESDLKQAIWPRLALEDLREALSRWRRRSAHFRSADVVSLLAEQAARARAVARGGELPARYVLGVGEKLETSLDLIRLVSLGARVEADGDDREIRVFLADPAGGTVLVLEKRWEYKEKPPDGSALGSRSITSQVRLGAVARGQLISRVARQRANQQLSLGQGNKMGTSVMADSADWSVLAAPVLVSDLNQLAAVWRARPPRLLRPRHRAEDIHVVALSAVEAPVYDAAEQRLYARATDAAGQPLLLSRTWDAAAIHAVEHLSGALVGQYGAPRFVSGALRWHVGRWELDVIAVAADRILVPDLEPGPPTQPAPARGLMRHPPSAIEQALHGALSALEEAAHQGLRNLQANYPANLQALTRRLQDVGLSPTASHVERLAAAITRARTDSDWAAACVAWEDAALRVQLLLEEVGEAS